MYELSVSLSWVIKSQSTSEIEFLKPLILLSFSSVNNRITSNYNISASIFNIDPILGVVLSRSPMNKYKKNHEQIL